MKFLGMGVPELLIILVVVLLIFGPKNLPKLGSAIGKSVKSLRDGMSSDEGKPEVEEKAGREGRQEGSGRGFRRVTLQGIPCAFRRGAAQQQTVKRLRISRGRLTFLG